MPREFLADNAAAITSALKQVFPNTVRKHCYSHVIMQIDRKLGEYGIHPAAKTKIKDDIRLLANASSLEHFEVLSKHYTNEWKEEFNEAVYDFTSYFLKQYVERDRNWFAANGHGVRTNNAVEAHNKWMKVSFITRRAPLLKAITLLKVWVKRARDKNYGTSNAVTDAELVNAFDFKRMTKLGVNEEMGCYFLRKSKSELSHEQFQNLIRTIYTGSPTSADLVLFQQNIAVVSASHLYDGKLTCNCHMGAQRKDCKHIILIYVRQGILNFENIESKRQLLSNAARQRAGRPRKFTPALTRG